jgi:predicted signal transduction protein with EAL and GGDEF domain
LARLGGDEFAIIQTAPTGADIGPGEGAIGLANRIADELTKPFYIEGQTVVIGTSIGIALAPDDGSDPDVLLKRADLALYEAKSAGRGCHRFFDQRMTLAADQAQRLESDMRQALDAGAFALHYQPYVDVATERVQGVEALVRWPHPTLGMISPGDFIPLAEATGLIVPLGRWIIQQACKDAARFPDHIKVAINLSAVQIGRTDLLESIVGAIAEAGLRAGRLEIEVTESVFLERNTSALTFLHQLKGMGVSIALDDFGTGYSSLSYLKAFPFDKIKIDQSFIHDMVDRDDCAAIVRSVIELGRSLNMTTTAEGVETQLQFDMIRAAGATFAQGYLFGRPVPNPFPVQGSRPI